jgi:hypothetical protein
VFFLLLLQYLDSSNRYRIYDLHVPYSSGLDIAQGVMEVDEACRKVRRYK